MRRPRFPGRPVPRSEPSPPIEGNEQTGTAREIATALLPLIAKADAARLPMAVYLLSMAQRELDKVGRLPLPDGGEA